MYPFAFRDKDLQAVINDGYEISPFVDIRLLLDKPNIINNMDAGRGGPIMRAGTMSTRTGRIPALSLVARPVDTPSSGSLDCACHDIARTKPQL